MLAVGWKKKEERDGELHYALTCNAQERSFVLRLFASTSGHFLQSGQEWQSNRCSLSSQDYHWDFPGHQNFVACNPDGLCCHLLVSCLNSFFGMLFLEIFLTLLCWGCCGCFFVWESYYATWSQHCIVWKKKVFLFSTGGGNEVGSKQS